VLKLVASTEPTAREIIERFFGVVRVKMALEQALFIDTQKRT
jgi:hypothetical protein